MQRFGQLLLEPEDWPLAVSSLAGVAVLWLVLRAVVSPAQRQRLLAPLICIALYIGLSVGIDVLPQRTRFLPYLSMLALLLLLLALGRLASLLLIDWLWGRRFGRYTPKIVRDIVEGVLVVIAVLLALRAGGVDTNSLLTTSALLTAIVGLSLQDTLGNLFAGLSLQAQHTFAVGEWIQIDREGQQMGRVIEINWRATKVLTRDYAELTIPNGQLARSVILNLSRPLPTAQHSIHVSVPYEVPGHTVHRVILRSIAHLPNVEKSPAPSVVTQAFGDFGVQYAVRYFSSDFEHASAVEGLVRDRVRSGLTRAGIPMASPLHPPKAALDQRVTGGELERQANVQAIRSIEFLRDLTDGAVADLAAAAHRQHYQQGEIVVLESEPGEELYLCLTGTLAVLRTRRDGSEQEVAQIGPGGFFGELSVMTGHPRTATVQARTACELLVVDKHAFSSVLAVDPKLAELISRRLAERQAQLDATGRESVEERRSSVESYHGNLLQRVRKFFSI